MEELLNRYPDLQAIKKLTLSIATALEKAESAEAEAKTASRRALEAQEKAIEVMQRANMALDETFRMKVADYVCWNGLKRQFPEHTWPAAGKWLVNYCEARGYVYDRLDSPEEPYPKTNGYPIHALRAWQRHAARIQGQRRLIPPEPRGAGQGNTTPAQGVAAQGAEVAAG